MKTMYIMDCEDGFYVRSYNKEEVIRHGMAHIREMHSEAKLSKIELGKFIRMKQTP